MKYCKSQITPFLNHPLTRHFLKGSDQGYKEAPSIWWYCSLFPVFLIFSIWSLYWLFQCVILICSNVQCSMLYQLVHYISSTCQQLFCYIILICNKIQVIDTSQWSVSPMWGYVWHVAMNKEWVCIIIDTLKWVRVPRYDNKMVVSKIHHQSMTHTNIHYLLILFF